MIENKAVIAEWPKTDKHIITALDVGALSIAKIKKVINITRTTYLINRIAEITKVQYGH